MGFHSCKGFCRNIPKVARRTEKSKKCSTCEYSTLIKDTYCPCCKTKYKIRKKTKKATKVKRT